MAIVHNGDANEGTQSGAHTGGHAAVGASASRVAEESSWRVTLEYSRYLGDRRVRALSSWL